MIHMSAPCIVDLRANKPICILLTNPAPACPNPLLLPVTQFGKTWANGLGFFFFFHRKKHGGIFFLLITKVQFRFFFLSLFGVKKDFHSDIKAFN